MFENFAFRNIPWNIEGPREKSWHSSPEYHDIPAVLTVSHYIFKAYFAVLAVSHCRYNVNKAVGSVGSWFSQGKQASCAKVAQKCIRMLIFRLHPLIFRSYGGPINIHKEKEGGIFQNVSRI